MAKYEKLVQQLRAGVICDVCDISAECDHSSCQIIDSAADAIENLVTETAALRRQIDNLTSAQAVMVERFNAKLEELHETKSELDEYYSRFGRQSPREPTEGE